MTKIFDHLIARTAPLLVRLSLQSRLRLVNWSLLAYATLYLWMGLDSHYWLAAVLHCVASALLLTAWITQRTSVIQQALAFTIALSFGQALAYTLDGGRTFPVATHLALAIALSRDHPLNRRTMQ